MNLTDPPEVRDLTPDRAARLSAGLVTAARKSTTRSARPAWVPMVAAGTGVAAVVTAGAIILPRTGDTPPVSGPPSASSSQRPAPTRPTPRGPVVTSWTAPSSGTVATDLGPASESDVRRALRRCFNAPGMPSFRPADADKAIIEWSRWMLKPVTFDADNRFDRTSGHQLVVSALRADRRAWATCADDQGETPGTQFVSGGDSKSAQPGSPNGASARQPVLAGGRSGYGTTRDGGWMMTWDSAFAAIPRAARAEFRITWPGGAGAWHPGYLHGGTGYADIAAGGRGTRPAHHRIEVRLLDRDGKVFYTTSAGQNTPIGVR